MSEETGRSDERERRRAVVSLWAFAVALVVALIATQPPEPHSEAFHDELHYAQQARDIAAGGFPRFNRIYAAFVPPLYGLVQAPVRYFAGREGMDWWSRALNALLVVSSVAPLYCLARRFLRPGWAVGAAALGVVAPSLVYVRYLLSEGLFFPLFLWLSLAVTRLCERATPARALQLGFVLGLCYLTRSIVIASVPAVFLALVWALRSPKPVARVALLLTLATLLVVLPWTLRARLFPSESALEAAFSYREGLRLAGLQPLGTYVAWIWKTLTCSVIGLGPVAFVLGCAGLLQALVHPDPGRRGFALFACASASATVVLVGIATAQWGPLEILKLHERYLVPFWPLFVISALALLHRERVSLHVLAVAGGLFLVVLLGLPDICFAPEDEIVNPIDFPSSVLAISIAALVGSPASAKLVYLALGAPLVLVLWKRRLAAPVLLSITGSYSIAGAWIALDQSFDRNRSTENIFRPVWDWLDGILQEGDLVIHHRAYGRTAYHNAMRYEMDYCQLKDDLTPLVSSSVRLERRTGRFEFFAPAPPARFWLLTDVPGEIHVPGIRVHEGLRLIPVQDGLAPLGAWLGGGEEPTVEGREADGWCRGNVRIGVANAFPCQAELSASVSGPGAGEEPLGLALLREKDLLFEELLHPGVTWTFYVSETLWAPRVDFSVQSAADGRELAFRMSEPSMWFEPWVPVDDEHELAGEPEVAGIHPDLWCERRVSLRFPLQPEDIRFSFVLSHPADSPVAGPLGITLRVGQRALERIELEPGTSRQILFTARTDRPLLDFVLEADRDAELDGRRVAFRVGMRG